MGDRSKTFLGSHRIAERLQAHYDANPIPPTPAEQIGRLMVERTKLLQDIESLESDVHELTQERDEWRQRCEAPCPRCGYIDTRYDQPK